MNTFRRKAKLPLATSITALLALTGVAAHSADVTWDIVGADSAITGGAGSWDLSIANWSIDGGVNNIQWLNANNDVAIFGAPGGLVTVDAPVTAGGLTFNADGYTLSGSPITLAGTSAVTVTNVGETATISSVLAGTIGLSKLGAGTLTLSGANTYTGVTTLGAGAVSVATIGNGGVAGGLGASTNVAANLVFDGGALQYTGATASTDRAFTINAAKTATVEVTQAGTSLTLSGASAATSGAFAKTGAGTLILTGANAHTGGTTVSAGTLQIGTIATGAGPVIGGGNVSIASGATLAFARNATGPLAVTNAISGPLGSSLAFLGSGVNLQSEYSLGGNNSGYLGAITISNSRVAVDATADIGSASITVTNTTQGANPGTGQVFISGTAATYTNAFTIAGSGWQETGGRLGAIRISNGSTLTNTITMTANSAIGTDGTGATSATISGAITDGGNGYSLEKVWNGNLILSGTNAYSGGTSITRGYLTFANAGALPGAGAISVSGNGALVASGVQTTVQGWLSTGLIPANSTGAIAINGNSAEAIDFTGFNSLALAAAVNATYSGTITPGTNGYRFAGAANTLTVTSPLGGANGVTKYGTGTTILNLDANTYTGGTTVTSGELQALVSIGAGAKSTFGSGAITVNGGATLRLKTGSTGNVLTWSNNISLDNGTLIGEDGVQTITGNVQIGAGGATLGSFWSGKNLVLANPASGAGLVTIRTFNSGGALVILAGTNNLTGNIDVGNVNGRGDLHIAGSTIGTNQVQVRGNNTSTLTVRAGGTLGTGTLRTEQSGASITVDAGGQLNTGTVAIAWNPATFAVNGQLNSTGAITWTTNASAAITGNGSISAASLTLGNTSVLTLNSSGSITTSGALTLGTGTATANTLTIQQGTVKTSGLALAQSTAQTVNLTGGRLILGSGGISTSGGGARTVNLGAASVGVFGSNWSSPVPLVLTSTTTGTTFDTLDVNDGTTARTITLSGILSGTGGVLNKVGLGTLNLTGANTFTGATNLNRGTLALDYVSGNTSRLSDSALLILNGGTLQFTGASGAHVELVSGTTLAGTAAISRSGGNTATIALAGISRNFGAALDVSIDNLASTTSPLVNGVLPGVTVAGVLATKSGNNIIANTAFADVSRLGGAISDGETTNARITEGGAAGEVTLGAATTNVNSLSNAGTGGSAVVDFGAQTLRLGTTGTIITGTGANGITLQNGTLTAGGNVLDGAGEILVTGAANAAISATIANNSAGIVSLGKAGSGTLTLSGTNTYTGQTAVTGGTLSIASNAALGAVATGAQLNLNGGTLQATASFALNNGGANHRNVALGSSGGTVLVDPSQTLTVSGVVSGTGLLTKSGNGTLALSATNTHTGGTAISAGTVSISANAALGTALVTLGDGNSGSSAISLLASGSVDPANPITVSPLGTGLVTIGSIGAGVASNATTYSGPMILNRATTFQATASDRTAFDGKISGNVGTLTIVGGSRATFASTLNEFVGNIDISGTNTVLQASAASAGEVIPNGANINVGSGAEFRLAGTANATETINALTGSGLIGRNVAGLQTLLVGSAGGTGSFSGIIQNGSGTVGLTKVGAGAQTLGGTSTYTGATTVNAGTLLVNGSISGSATTVNSGGTIGGSGTLGTLILAAGGTVAPGTSPGILSAGSTTFNGGTFALELNGSIVGTGYDQLSVTGTVTLAANTALSISLGYDPIDFVDTFTIIANDPADTVAGTGLFTFAGNPLAQGALFTASGQDFTISYVGGDGNDVVLSAVPEPGAIASLLGGLAILASVRRRRQG